MIIKNAEHPQLIAKNTTEEIDYMYHNYTATLIFDIENTTIFLPTTKYYDYF